MEADKSYREGIGNQERAFYFNKLKLILGSTLSNDSISLATAIRLLTLLYNTLYRV